MLRQLQRIVLQPPETRSEPAHLRFNLGLLRVAIIPGLKLLSKAVLARPVELVSPALVTRGPEDHLHGQAPLVDLVHEGRHRILQPLVDQGAVCDRGLSTARGFRLAVEVDVGREARVP